ncbi:hypothetical protein [Myroides guanonis]|uniref:Uncharacterized protein n=1 Tax=Myroides guanonis TaxID=1150112 RepID=A0A1I3PGA9_9FLAO|nr:hypothetical protein [Myroides guanonis]SFJ20595.1 hypothetical protein SAMN04487893_104119 [Myroides guanonis]
MKTFLFTFFFFIVYHNTISQSLNYKVYHEKINHAEELYFVKNETDSALTIYDEVFLEFNDFIFLKDFLNAAQISMFEGRNPENYIIPAFRFGFKINDLKHFPILSKLGVEYKKNKLIIKKEEEFRKLYLDNIDVDYLAWIYTLAEEDNKAKNKRDKYFDKVFIPRNIKALEEKISTIGFPGEKFLGIVEDSIFKELGNERYKDFPESQVLSNIMSDTSYYEKMASILVYPFLLHNKCSFAYFRKTFLKEIEKGNMHPRDAAHIFDDNQRYQSRRTPSKEYSYTCNNSTFKYELYYVNDTRTIRTDRTQAEIVKRNKNRAALYLCSIEVDEAKQEFVDKHNFRLFTGHWITR